MPMTERPAGGPVWFRSLYWRIAIGVVALFAALLVAQALVFLWLSGSIAANLMGSSPEELAAQVATETASALQQNPSLDLESFVRERYSRYYQPLMVVLEDGRVARNHEPPAVPGRGPGLRGPRADGGRGGMADSADRGAGGPPAGGTRRPDAAAGEAPPPGAGGSRFSRGGRVPPGSRPMAPLPGGQRASIEVAGSRVGFVAVAGRGPRTEFLLRQFGPALAVIGTVLLLVGSAVSSLAIFRPARRRLRALETVARAIGEGNASARAPESGGDEVTALARAINQMASDLEARTSAMEASDRTRRQLLADVSHELKTPLAAIRGYVETLAMPEVELDADIRRRYLDIVGEETIKLEGIVGDLLDLARLEGGGMTLTCESVPVAALFQRVNDRHERGLLEKQINVETAIAPDAGEVWADPARIEQALQNLVSNALRHVPEGGQITLASERAGGRVRLIVRDSGPGIPEDHLPRIFDRFYKTDASRSDPYSKSGSGLGLSIVKAIVELHGGSAAAANLAGGGAEFAIALPPRPA
ncbi:MAG TPA: HAMP domain-containing sensor histidine kinase [Vicinamibacterales bacterium]|nr:HAMP domain-containing sensor histidine kinase [Vicinamibacterales bacterium]HPW19445.1 HAMP domain-containing sensor histidine kinase [Vicinamibacterales bacterium]